MRVRGRSFANRLDCVAVLIMGVWCYDELRRRQATTRLAGFGGLVHDSVDNEPAGALAQEYTCQQSSTCRCECDKPKSRCAGIPKRMEHLGSHGKIESKLPTTILELLEQAARCSMPHLVTHHLNWLGTTHGLWSFDHHSCFLLSAVMINQL